MTHKEYNGWTNYETWNVALWLSNDQGTESYCRELAESAMENHDNDTHEAVCAMADSLKDYIEEQNPCADRADLFADLMNAALSEVNWGEIAEHYVADVEIEEEEEEDEEEA